MADNQHLKVTGEERERALESLVLEAGRKGEVNFFHLAAEGFNRELALKERAKARLIRGNNARKGSLFADQNCPQRPSGFGVSKKLLADKCRLENRDKGAATKVTGGEDMLWMGQQCCLLLMCQ